MAANPNKIPTLNIPTEVVDSAWRDDIDKKYAEEENVIPFEFYGKDQKQEGEFISPDKVVTKETQRKIDRIKAKKIGATVSDIFKLQTA